MAFHHTIYVRECAFTVSIQTGISDYPALCTHMYRMMRDPDVKASITQAAIRDGVAAANAHRTNMENNPGKPPSEPVFTKPVLKFNTQNWRLNQTAEGFIAIANVGSLESPCEIIINVSRTVAKRVLQYKPGELWITPDTYTITFSAKVPGVKRPVPSGESKIIELVADVGRVSGPPKNIIAVDANARNITAGDGHTTVKFDLTGPLNDIMEAKTREAADTTYDRMRDDVKYKARTGREVSRVNEEARRARQKELYGGQKHYRKLKRQYRNCEKAGKAKEAAEIKAKMDMCVLDARHEHTKRRVDPKKSAVTKATRTHEHMIHVVALVLTMWAYKSNSLLVLENLDGMYEGWSKEKGRFNKAVRRKLYSAAILKISRIIYGKARMAGVEAVRMNPYHTSKLCAECRGKLSGGYRLRTCRRCDAGVDRDVNAVENMRRTTAAARYGPQVRAGLGEARRVADIILDPAALAQGRWSDWADRLAAAVK